MRFIWLALLACLGLAGCKLIDQNTFAPAPEAKAQPSAPPAPVQVDPRRSLVTIDAGATPDSYEQLLRYAVRAAEARDRYVEYDVVAVVPNVTEATTGQQDAAEVMRSIMAAGVPANRIHLQLRA